MTTRIKSLHFYPIKSCRGLDTDTIELIARGPKHDREWMIVRAENGEFLTQRQLPQLALIRTRIERGTLVLTLPSLEGTQDFHAPISPPPHSTSEIFKVKVWADTCDAIAGNPLADRALSEFLKINVKLVQISTDFKRFLDPKYGHSGKHTGFADGFPLLLASDASLNELNTRLEAPIPMTRFRANIVIERANAFAEDSWRKIRIGDIEFEVVKPCTRCIIINTDQAIATRSAEPLKTLATYRRDERGKVNFGQNLVHLGLGTIRVGDTVEILETI